MTDKTEAKEQKVEHKVGLHRYATAGSNRDYVIIGAPRVQGDRWVTVSHIGGGQVAAFPGERFEREFWIPNLAAE
jgi:hypothetical protein